MDFSPIYALGMLSAVHLLLTAYTGKSIERSETIDPKTEPARFRASVFCSAALVVIAILFWLASTLFGLEKPG